MWKLEFKDRHERTVEVTITKTNVDDSDEPILLTGAAEPLTLDDNDSSDALVPMRTSTGYLRVINNAAADGLMPMYDMEHLVTVKVGGTVTWQGYMKADNYGRDMYLPDEEIDFAIADVLEMLDTTNMRIMPAFELQTVRDYMIETIRSIEESNNFANPRIAGVIFPNEVAEANTTDYDAWLNVQVHRYNWFKASDADNMDDPSYKPYDGITYKELLENIAKMFGWTVTMDGEYILFASAVSFQLLRLTTLELNSGHPSSAYSTRMVELRTIAPASADNQIEQVAGVRKLTVTGNANLPSDIALISTAAKPFVWALYHQDLYDVKQDLRAFDNSGDQRLTLHHYRIDSPTSSTELPYDAMRDDIPNSAFVLTHLVRQAQYSQEDYRLDKVKYSFRDGIYVDIYHRFVDWGSYSLIVPLATFNTIVTPTYPDGAFTLNYNVKTYDESMVTDQGVGTGEIKHSFTMKVSVRIGEYCWNGTRWMKSLQDIRFDVTVEDGKVKDTLDRYPNEFYEDPNGYLMPIRGIALGGTATIKLYSWNINTSTSALTDNQKAFLSDVKFDHTGSIPLDSRELKDSTKMYSMKESRTGDKKIELPVCTFHPGCEQGFGTLMYGDERLTDQLDYLQNGIRLEQNVLNKMKSVYHDGYNVARPMVMNNDTRISKTARIMWDNKMWKVVARSQNFRDGTQVLTLIEQKNYVTS